MDDERSIAAELEQHALAAGVGLNSQPTLAEPVKLTSLMRSSFSASQAVSALESGRTARASSGQPALRMTSPSASAVKGVCGAGLRMSGQPAASAGASLVGNEIERKVEGRDGEDGADGKALHEAPAIFVAFGEVERDGFAAEAYGFFGSGFEGEDGAVDFSAGQAHGLAGFGDDELGEALLLLDERGGDVFEDLAALPAGQGAGAAQAGDCMIDGLARIGACGHGDAADEALIPRANGLQALLAVDPFFAAQQKAGLRSRAHLHGAGSCS